MSMVKSFRTMVFESARRRQIDGALEKLQLSPESPSPFRKVEFASYWSTNFTLLKSMFGICMKYIKKNKLVSNNK